MKIKTFNDNYIDGDIKTILHNRGIEDVDKWINAEWEDINLPYSFKKEKIDKAISFLEDSLKWQIRSWSNNKPTGQKICVIVDCDADGMTSSAIIINYLTELMKYTTFSHPKKNIQYILHKGKEHGLSDVYSKIGDDIDLVIIPDAGTSNIEELKKLSERGIRVLVADHHLSDETYEDENIVIINNQIDDYPNKDLSGAGVIWQVCRAYDFEYGLNTAYNFIDLAALGILSDMCSFKSIENRAIIKLGLEKIKNPFFYYMVEKNKFSIDKMGGINYMSIAFYVTPFINAVIRSGTMEEKELVFKSMLTAYAFDKIPSEKRGHKGEMVPLVEEAVRICTNVKARQTKLQDITMNTLEKKIQDENLLDNAILMLLCEPGEVESNLQGLVANKLQAKYQHPTMVLTKSKTKDDKEYFYRGSIRNYSMSENQDMRQLCLDTGIPEYVQGHENAAGCSIAESRVNDFIEATNKLYENVSNEPCYWVDFIWRENDIKTDTILQIAENKDYWGQGIPESYICLKDIPIGINNVRLLSENKNPTLKIHLDCGLDIMKFKSSREEYEKLIEPNTTITLVGKCNKNEWNNRISAQIIIEFYELKQEWIF